MPEGELIRGRVGTVGYMGEELCFAVMPVLKILVIFKSFGVNDSYLH